MDISRITKVILENYPVKMKFKKNWKSLFSNGIRSSQPKYHIPKWKIVTGRLKMKITSVTGISFFLEMLIKALTFLKNTKKGFFSCPKDHSLKIRFLGQKMCSVARMQRDTKVNNEDTLSGFSFNLKSKIGPTLYTSYHYYCLVHL